MSDEFDATFDEGKPVTLQEPVVEPAAPVAAPVIAEGEPATPPVAEKKSELIPLSAHLDERDKRQRAERELEALRSKLNEYEAKPAAPPPDIYADPEARLNFEGQRYQAALVNSKLETSRFLAEREYGKELVEKAYRYFDDHIDQSKLLLNDPSPFHSAVEAFKRHMAVEEVGPDPAAYKARILAEAKAAMEAEIRAELSANVQPPAKLPGSLAAAPAAGKSNETIPRGGAFEAAFGG